MTPEKKKQIMKLVVMGLVVVVAVGAYDQYIGPAWDKYVRRKA